MAQEAVQHRLAAGVVGILHERLGGRIREIDRADRAVLVARRAVGIGQHPHGSVETVRSDACDVHVRRQMLAYRPYAEIRFKL